MEMPGVSVDGGLRERETSSADVSVIRRIRAELPGALDRVYRAYSNRLDADLPADAKDFASAQAACRAALTHVLLLLKLADQLSRSDCVHEDAEDLDALITEARSALNR